MNCSRRCPCLMHRCGLAGYSQLTTCFSIASAARPLSPCEAQGKVRHVSACACVFASLHLRLLRRCAKSPRGTLSVADVLTDLGAEEVELFLGGKAGRPRPQPCGLALRILAALVFRDFLFLSLRLTRTCCRVPATFFGSLGQSCATFLAKWTQSLLRGTAWVVEWLHT